MSAVTAVQVGGSPRCRACAAAIWFGLTVKGRRMPIDPAPAEDGNVVIDADVVLHALADLDARTLPHVRVLGKGEAVDPDVPRYRSHFSTCPAAERFRRPKAKATS
ncbi:MAG: hypothetical protein QOD63_843 [Actinomycetota bacterium]|jgi:hypothetical protein|nr:hypothetical protein [Actinomycetota bacterium]